MDLNDLSLAELKQLSKDIDKALVTLEKRRKLEAQAAAKAVAAEYGFSLDEIFGGTTAKSRSDSLPQYADPRNPDQTWSGRGRRPNWVIAYLEEGVSLEDLKI
jgi:DNA-binding protein H-NS